MNDNELFNLLEENGFESSYENLDYLKENADQILLLDCSDVTLCEGMAPEYMLMQILDKNGFVVNENNLSVLSAAIENGHVLLTESKKTKKQKTQSVEEESKKEEKVMSEDEKKEEDVRLENAANKRDAEKKAEAARLAKLHRSIDYKNNNLTDAKEKRLAKKEAEEDKKEAIKTAGSIATAGAITGTTATGVKHLAKHPEKAAVLKTALGDTAKSVGDIGKKVVDKAGVGLAAAAVPAAIVAAKAIVDKNKKNKETKEYLMSKGGSRTENDTEQLGKLLGKTKKKYDDDKLKRNTTAAKKEFKQMQNDKEIEAASYEDI